MSYNVLRTARRNRTAKAPDRARGLAETVTTLLAAACVLRGFVKYFRPRPRVRCTFSPLYLPLDWRIWEMSTGSLCQSREAKQPARHEAKAIDSVKNPPEFAYILRLCRPRSPRRTASPRMPARGPLPPLITTGRQGREQQVPWFCFGLAVVTLLRQVAGEILR